MPVNRELSGFSCSLSSSSTFVLAIVTIGWFQPSRAVSIWTFALLALISTAFALSCGGRFRTFYIAIAVTLPFLFLLRWFFRMRSAFPDFPGKAVGEYFLYFVAAPIALIWSLQRCSIEMNDRPNSRARHHKPANMGSNIIPHG
jgi:hypothetical protein